MSKTGITILGEQMCICHLPYIHQITILGKRVFICHLPYIHQMMKYCDCDGSSSSSSVFPSYISGVHHFGWHFCVCDRFLIHPLRSHIPSLWICWVVVCLYGYAGLQNHCLAIPESEATAMFVCWLARNCLDIFAPGLVESVCIPRPVSRDWWLTLIWSKQACEPLSPDEDVNNDWIEQSFRAKFVTNECPRGLSMGVSSKVGGSVVMVESARCWEVRGWWGRGGDPWCEGPGYPCHRVDLL